MCVVRLHILPNASYSDDFSIKWALDDNQPPSLQVLQSLSVMTLCFECWNIREHLSSRLRFILVDGLNTMWFAITKYYIPHALLIARMISENRRYFLTLNISVLHYCFSVPGRRCWTIEFGLYFPFIALISFKSQMWLWQCSCCLCCLKRPRRLDLLNVGFRADEKVQTVYYDLDSL